MMPRVPRIPEIICSTLEINYLQAMNPMSNAPQSPPEQSGGLSKVPKGQFLPFCTYMVHLCLLRGEIAISPPLSLGWPHHLL